MLLNICRCKEKSNISHHLYKTKPLQAAYATHQRAVNHIFSEEDGAWGLLSVLAAQEGKHIKDSYVYLCAKMKKTSRKGSVG